MANANKAKGTTFETAVVKELTKADLDAHKPRQVTPLDVGDIHLGDDIVLQAKAWKNLAGALSEGTKGATIQAERAKRPFGIAVIKKPRGSILDAYVVMSLKTFIRFLARKPTGGPSDHDSTSP